MLFVMCGWLSGAAFWGASGGLFLIFGLIPYLILGVYWDYMFLESAGFWGGWSMVPFAPTFIKARLAYGKWRYGIFGILSMYFFFPFYFIYAFELKMAICTAYGVEDVALRARIARSTHGLRYLDLTGREYLGPKKYDSFDSWLESQGY